MSNLNIEVIHKEDAVEVFNHIGMRGLAYRSHLGKINKRTPFKGQCFKDKDIYKRHVDALIKLYKLQFNENIALSEEAVGFIDKAEE